MEREDYANVRGPAAARPKWRVIIRGIMVIKTLNPHPRLAVSLARLHWEYPESRQLWVDPSSTVISATPWLSVLPNMWLQVVYNISWIMKFSVYGHGQCLFPAILCRHSVQCRYRSGQNMMSWPGTIPQQHSSTQQVAAPWALYAHIRHR